MINQGYRVKRKGLRMISVLKFLLFALFLTFPFTLSPSPLTYAQEISPETKKNVVQNYKVNLSDYLTFGTDCSLKPRGDANCDKVINQFDLSIWEIEFNAPDSPRRSDFNADGQVNLLDFGIWRNTFYTEKSSGIQEYLSSLIESGIQKILPGFRVKPGMTIYAQEPQPNTQPLDASQAFVSGSGNGLVVNSEGSNSQQVNFNSEGDALSSQIYGANGQLLAGVRFLESGTTTISTQQDGVSIRTNKTAQGAVIEFYNNPNGSLIATKSWPSQASYDAGDPPTAVTLPGRDPNTFLTLNIQPNGGGVLQEFNNQGDILRQNQINGNGLYASYDARTKTTMQTINKLGFSTMNMPNSLGGSTTYYFFINDLYSIIQTDSNKNTWIANLNAEGKWEIFNALEGPEKKKAVDDPVKELNSNTPSPNKLIATWNYYGTNARTTEPEVEFATGFSSNSRAIATQIDQADQAYAIYQVAPPTNVLGIIKEANAQEAKVEQKSTSNPYNGVAVQVIGFTGDDGQLNMTVTVFGPGPTGAAQVQTSTSTVTLNSGTAIPDVTGKSTSEATQAINATAAAGNAQTAPGSQPLNTLTVPVPPAPKEPADPVAQPQIQQPPAAPPPAAPKPPDPPATAPGTRPDPPAEAPAPPTHVPNNWPKDASGNPLGTQKNDPADYGNRETSTSRTQHQDGSSTYTTTGTNLGFTQSSTYGADGVPTGTDIAFTEGAYAGTSMHIGSDNMIESVTAPGIGTISYTSEGQVTINGEVIDPSDARYDAARDTFNEQVNNREEATGIQQDEIGCFLAGTLVSTPNGFIPIETLKPGMEVYSFNEKTKQKEISSFKELDINFVDEYLIINGKIKTTIYHPFYRVVNNSLETVRADSLRPGDVLQGEEGGLFPITSIQRIEAKTTVYNLLDVSPNNNFFAEKILVHNYETSAPASEAESGGEPTQDPGFGSESFDDNQQGSVDQNSQSGGGGSGEANN